MKILHIAAFSGNIGDNASHLGFDYILKSCLKSYNVDRIEIRKAYKNYTAEDKLRFDNSFVDLANQYDVVVFGGGGFLDYWVKGSSNGTTIDIEIDILKQIKSNVLISSVGCNPHREVPIENYEKFKRFLSFIKQQNNIKIALRNDGSLESIRKDFGEDYLAGLTEILDHGYFYALDDNDALPIKDSYVAFNITDDQIKMQGNTIADSDWYYSELETTIQKLAERGYKTVFVPHIHQDIEAIATALNKMPVSLVREHTVIAPCIQSDLGTHLNFRLYKNAEFVIASRYHSNVCSISFGVPTIGLSPLPRIAYTHKQLLSNKSNIALQKGFNGKIIELIDEKITVNYKSEVLDKMKAATLSFYHDYFASI